ncbi:MAG: alcohol dehydrogenase catalytic domain-containing protein, partial [Eggerthellaceae bacterium]|nr:alcohol dehydrogenase catalytic domain-containing protein [Eggerthellaceae bacterium]
MEGTMKQLIFKTKGEVELADVPIPEFGPDGLLIKVAYAGICGSDVHGYTKGGLYGGIADGSKFGHEFVGYVVETGENVQGFKEGDRVWVDPNFVSPMGGRFSCMAG